MNTTDGDVDGFEVFIGGGVGRDPALARRVGVRMAAAEAGERLAQLFRTYLADRLETSEPFRAWVDRVGNQRVRDALIAPS